MTDRIASSQSTDDGLDAVGSDLDEVISTLGEAGPWEFPDLESWLDRNTRSPE